MAVHMYRYRSAGPVADVVADCRRTLEITMLGGSCRFSPTHALICGGHLTTEHKEASVRFIVTSYRKDWEQIQQRYEAFWQGELVDRPLLKVTSARRDGPPPMPAGLLPRDPAALQRYFLDPAYVIPRLERNLARTHFAGDAIPTVFPVACSLVAIQAAYLGGDYRIAPENGSGWCDPVIKDWRRSVPLSVSEDNFWWRQSQVLLKVAAEVFRGRAIVGIPDLQGGGQILALLRGSEKLAMDLLEEPDAIREAMEKIDATWFQYWRRCNNLIIAQHQGYMDWLGMWSVRPAVTVECDYSIMISPEMFTRFFLPSIERQARGVERAIYHLDGTGAARHLDALLELHSLTGVQWVPGAGAAPMSSWIPLLKRIQAVGKRLVLNCRSNEVMTLLGALRPEGISLETVTRTPEEAESLVTTVTQEFARRGAH